MELGAQFHLHALSVKAGHPTPLSAFENPTLNETVMAGTVS